MGKSKQVIVFGLGEFGEVMHFYLTHDSEYEVVAFTVDRAYANTPEFLGLPVVPFDELPDRYPPARYAMLVAIGYTDANAVRERKYEEARAKGYALISYVSSKATVWPGLKLGDNCIILEDNTIQPFSRIGSNVILWSGNHIGHHAAIGDHCFVASHVVVSGGVKVGANCFLGVNSCIRDHVSIAPRTIVGMGAAILRDTREGEVYKVSQPEPLPVSSGRVKI